VRPMRGLQGLVTRAAGAGRDRGGPGHPPWRRPPAIVAAGSGPCADRRGARSGGGGDLHLAGQGPPTRGLTNGRIAAVLIPTRAGSAQRTTTSRCPRVAYASGIDEVRIAYRAPRMNAITERFLGSVRRESLDHLIILGDRHLEGILKEYTRYFKRERPHQGLGQQLPEPVGAPVEDDASALWVRSVPILGGLHHAYHRAA